MAFNYYATGAYLLPRFNTGLIIAASKMKRGYLMEIVDLDTKAQAIEAGAHPRLQRALDGQMEELAQGLHEKDITLAPPDDPYDNPRLAAASRLVIPPLSMRHAKAPHGQV